MRGTKGVLLLVLSGVAGLAAVSMIGQQNPAVAVAPASSVKIVIAKEDLPMGQLLDVKMLKSIDWSAADLPKGAFKTMDELKGRVIRTSLTQGEPILEPKLAPKGSKGGLSSLIGQGNRAITVKVNEVVGVAGFALPGNFVDVLVSTKDNIERPISKIVLERILVLSIAQQTQRDDTAPRVVNAVTLEVSPEQAERLDLARSIGALSLVLRNQVDLQAGDTKGARKTDLIGKEAKKRAAPIKRPVRRVAKAESNTVEVIRGIQRSNKAL